MENNLAHIGCIGHTAHVGGEALIEAPIRFLGSLTGPVSVGAFTYAQSGTSLHNVEIGRFCSIAFGVTVSPGEHPIDWLSTHPFVCSHEDVVIGVAPFYPDYNEWLGAPVTTPRHEKRVIIGSDVWIGHNAIILQGVSIGHGAIIAAGAVVARDVEPYSIVGGVPARHIRYRFEEDIRERLLDLQFWNYDLSPLTKMIDYSKIEGAIEDIEAAIRYGIIAPLRPPKYKISKGTVTPA